MKTQRNVTSSNHTSHNISTIVAHIISCGWISQQIMYIFYLQEICNLIWGCVANTHLEPLVLLQKKCIRNISKAGYIDHTEPLFSEHKVLTVKEIYSYNCSKFIFQCYNNSNYLYFKNKLKRNNDFHNYNICGI